MIRCISSLLAVLLLAALPGEASQEEGILLLPRPQTKGRVSLEEAIASRRTRRSFLSTPLRLEELSQLLWAAQGITGTDGYLRAAPSAGALYPLDLYALVGQGSVQGLEAGVYHYRPSRHGLEKTASGDRRQAMARACLGQSWMADAPASLVLTAEYRRIEGKYGRRGRTYAAIEVGHAGQNLFLQAEALGLGAGIVGAFDDAGLAKVLGLPAGHVPLLVMPVGHTPETRGPDGEKRRNP